MNKLKVNQVHSQPSSFRQSKNSSNSNNSLPSNGDLIYLGSINNNFNKRRYIQMKHQAARAMKKEKIFAMYGICEPIRTELIKRGWVEKLSLSDMTKIRKSKFKGECQNALERVILSVLVANARPTFIWNINNDLNMDEKHRNYKAKYNRLEISHLWATKLGLCAALKNDYWFYIEDVAEVNSPRTYTCVDKGDMNDFKNDFKLTACTSLLKWLLSMVDNEQPIFLETGTININVIVFAINRCKEYIFRKQNKDIDKNVLSRVINGHWNTFLKNYYTLIARQDTFKVDKDNKVPLFLKYARYLLQEIQKYRPELNCEGWHDIWIIKPAHSSRGRGIRLASKFGVLIDLMSRGKYVAQKYIEEPLLIYETKFDIRQYYLITNTCPLEIWMYKECYLKFSSQKYNILNFHESIHLTNNAVQRNYTNSKDRHPELPKYNMWSSDTFKKYLNDTDNEYVWDTIIYPGMKKSIVGIMTSCQESISHCANRFELYGCDFILDNTFKPWLIEINSSPDFSPTTPVTSIICPAVLSDTIKVVIDHAADENAPTGNFECIYRQPHWKPVNDASADQHLRVQGRALSLDYFYKGNIRLIETNSYASSGRQDLTVMLKMLKTTHEATNTNQKPEDDSFTQPNDDSLKNNCTTGLGEDVNELASEISEQIDAIMAQIPSVEASTHKTNDKPRHSSKLDPASGIHSDASTNSADQQENKFESDFIGDEIDKRLVDVSNRLYSFLNKIEKD